MSDVAPIWLVAYQRLPIVIPARVLLRRFFVPCQPGTS